MEAGGGQAQADFEALLNLVLPFAQVRVVQFGAVVPFGAFVSKAGGEAEIVMLAQEDEERPEARRALEWCVSTLIGKRAEVRATAVVTDAGDAISADLEHEDGQAMRIIMPYAKKRFRKGIEFGELQAAPGNRRVWA